MWPFLYATPDFLCKCDCCGQGALERWSAHITFIDGIDFDSYGQKKSFCLKKNGSMFSLKRDHDYHYQAQQQIHITNWDYLDFV